MAGIPVPASIFLKMAKRRYKSNCSKLSVHIVVNGELVIHEFKGKDFYSKERFSDVVDPEVQKALESAPAFGVYFYKSSEFDWLEIEERDAEEEKALTKVADKAPVEVEPQSEEIELEEGDLVEYAETGKLLEFKDGNLEETNLIQKEFTTVSEAKKWLHSEFKVSMAKLGNREIVVAKAIELGFEVVFIETI